MHRGHPLLCGTLLGLTWTLLSLLFQGVDWLAAWSLEREGAALLGMTAVGALIAAVPKPVSYTHLTLPTNSRV